MFFNVRKLELFIKTKEHDNEYEHTLDDILVISLSCYKDIDSDTLECCLIDSYNFKRMISYILKEETHHLLNGNSVVPLDGEILKYIYLTINKIKTSGSNDRQKNNYKRQINTLKECIITRKENEIICASMY